MSATPTPPIDDLQLRGRHVLFMGDVATVWTSHGHPRLSLSDCATGVTAGATLTPDQADELARDLQAYAEAARRGA